MTIPSSHAVEQWLAQRRAWAPTGLPTNATDAGRRFRCDLIEAELRGRACALRHLQHAEREWPTQCAGCAAGARRAELLQIERAGVVANRRELLDEVYLAQIGRMPDDVLARRAGVSLNAVQRARIDLGVAKYAGPRCTPRGAINWPLQDWAESYHLIARQVWRRPHGALVARRSLGVEQSPWDAAGLGTVPDAVLAARLGIDVDASSTYRRRCALPAADRPARRSKRVFVAWDTVDDLGRVPDADVAERLWVTVNAVADARKARGIPAMRPHVWRVARVDWDAQPLGAEPDQAIADRLGLDRCTVARQREERGIPVHVRRSVLDAVDWDEQPLGIEPDTVIAERIGCSAPTIASARAERGIPAWTPAGHVDWDEEPLGIEADTAIADRLGVYVGLVRQARYDRHICCAPPLRSLEVLRTRGEVGAAAAAWADEQHNSLLAGQWLLRAVDGDFGRFDQVVEALGERFTVTNLQRWGREQGLDSIGLQYLMRVEVIAGRLIEAGDPRGRTYTLASAGPRPTLSHRTATVDEVFAHTPITALDNGLLRHLFGWSSTQAQRWGRRQAAQGHLTRQGRCAATHYRRPPSEGEGQTIQPGDDR